MYSLVTTKPGFSPSTVNLAVPVLKVCPVAGTKLSRWTLTNITLNLYTITTRPDADAINKFYVKQKSKFALLK